MNTKTNILLTSHRPKGRLRPLLSNVAKNYDLYIISIPALLYFLIFHYGPMYGVQIAFKEYMPTLGFWNSPWAGFEHFERFFNSYHFWALLKNTLGISIYSLVVGFPLPIILALMLNEVRHKTFKNTVQMVTYAPHFISTVVMAGMITVFLSPDTGIVNKLIGLVGVKPIYFMGKPELFKSIYVFSGIWQGVGWSSIIYMSALSGIDTQQVEAAVIDGASRLQKIIYIDIPGIIPTAVILLILNVGSVMSVGFEKVFLLQNEMNMATSDIIATYTYRVGLINAQYSFSAAVGLFNSVVNFILLITVNSIARRLGENSLW